MDMYISGPVRVYLNKDGVPVWWQRFVEAYWIITGKHSLVAVWSSGVTHGTLMEYQRIRGVNK